VLRRGGLVVAAALAPALGAGCGGAAKTTGPGHEEHAAKVASARRVDPRAVLGLSPERAAARLMLVGFRGTGRGAALIARLRDRDYGGVVVNAGNYVDDTQLGALVDAINGASHKSHHAPPLVFGDRLPVAMSTLHGAHVDATFGPVADLAITGGPHERDAFSDDPRATAKVLARAVALRSAAHVASMLQHFPGEGSASSDPELGPATVGESLADLRGADLIPFQRLAGRVSAVMMSDALYTALDPVTPATELPAAVALLRKLGFHGVVVSGDLSAASLIGGEPVAASAVAALRAGCDLAYIPGDASDQEAAYRAIVRAIRSGAIAPGRAASALKRVALLQRAHH